MIIQLTDIASACNTGLAEDSWPFPPHGLRPLEERIIREIQVKLRIGNAPCSWGVEFADDPRNPPWERVLDETVEAGYEGTELGPIGFMPEDPALLG